MNNHYLVVTLRLIHILSGAAWVSSVLLFTFYMVTDPGTTPSTRRGQIIFGFCLSAVYGTLVALHIQYQLFFALFTVCMTRGLILNAVARGWVTSRQPAPAVKAEEARQPVAV